MKEEKKLLSYGYFVGDLCLRGRNKEKNIAQIIGD